MRRYNSPTLPPELILTIADDLEPEDLYSLILAVGINIIPSLPRHTLVCQAPQNRNTVIHLMIKRGRKDMIDLLPPNTFRGPIPCDYDKQSPFLLASRRNDQEMAQLLLDKGCRLSRDEDSQEYPELLRVYENGHLAMIPLLLRAGADPHPEDHRHSVIFKAVRKQELDILQLFIDEGIEICFETNKITRRSALMKAVSESKLDSVRFLLDSVVKPIEDQEHRRQLQKALKKALLRPCPYELVRCLLGGGADPSLPYGSGYNALFIAICWKDKDLVSLLLEAGADTSSRDPNGLEPLHFATRYGQEEIVRLILDHGADVSSLERDGADALKVASACRFAGIVRLLLERGADISKRYDHGDTPLHLAVGGGNDIFKVILEYKPDLISKQNNRGETALQKAILAAEQNNVKWLLAAGTDVTIRDSQGRDAWEAAKYRGNERIIKVLSEAGVDRGR